MNTRRAIAVGLVVFVASVATASAASPRQPLEFVHALQEGGYGDVAVDYLMMLARQPKLPRELRDTWDLEMAKSLQAAADDTAFNTKESTALKQAAWKHLARFIEEKPDRPEAVTAISSWADFLVRQAMAAVHAANAAESGDVQQHDVRMAEARATLAEARQKYGEAQAKFKARLAGLPPRSKLPTKKADRAELSEARERAETDVRQTEIQLALIDYYLAQTYSDPKDAARIDLLSKAAWSLDAIFQRNRGDVLGMYAHLWHGRVAEELGDHRLALDIFDEVLAAAPEPSDRSPATGLEALFAETQRWRLMVLAKKDARESLDEGIVWLREHHRWKQLDGYQGIALDTTRAMLAAAKKATGPERSRLLGEALQIATEGSKIRSPFQQDLCIRRQELLRLSGRGLEASSFEEARALGDAAATSSDWSGALEAYGKAIDLAEKTRLNNPAAIAAVREAMLRAQVMIARESFDKGRWNECAARVAEIVRDPRGNVRRQSAAAVQAAALGVAAAWKLYASVPELQKPAALAKLLKAAELIETNWPDRPEADAARMARGQAKLVAGEVRDAAASFRASKPEIRVLRRRHAHGRTMLLASVRRASEVMPHRARSLRPKWRPIAIVLSRVFIVRSSFLRGDPAPAQAPTPRCVRCTAAACRNLLPWWADGRSGRRVRTTAQGRQGRHDRRSKAGAARVYSGALGTICAASARQGRRIEQCAA